MNEMSGWARVAIVLGGFLSMAWVVYMLYLGSEQMRAERLSFAHAAAKSCDENKSKEKKECDATWRRAYFEAQKRQDDMWDILKPGVFEAFFPLPFAWGLAFGIVAVVRWVAEGFRPGRRDPS